MQEIQVMEIRGIRVLTTRQIAEMYETTKEKIIYNFNYNKEKYVPEKHFIEVSGEELRRLKTTCENQISFKHAKTLYLWTEKGALLHAKSLNTDKAWEVYDYLVDFYFRAKESSVPVIEDKTVTEHKAIEKQEVAEYDIAPMFRSVIEQVPIEALDTMEKVMRTGNEKALKMATLNILAEKMKRQIQA